MTARFRYRIASLVAAVAAGISATVSAAPPPTTPPTSLMEALSAVDFLPTADEITARTSGDLQVLIELATSEADQGIRLRAIRALGLFPTDLIRQTLTDFITVRRTASAGTDVLILIASIEALGPIGGPDSVSVFVPLLSASSRDVRLSAARALGNTGSTDACTNLRARQSLETISQVRIAIDAAIVNVCP